MSNPFPPAAPAWQPPAQPQQTYAQPPGQFYSEQAGGQQYAPPAQPAAPQPPANTEGFFGGPATLSFADASTKGRPRGGLVISKAVTQRTNMQSGQPESWPNGQPKMQMAVVLQTTERADPNDDGKRTLYVKSHMVKAVKNALLAANVPDLELGGELLVAWIDEAASKTPGFGNAKIFAAQYTPAARVDANKYAAGAPTQPSMQAPTPPPAQPSYQPTPEFAQTAQQFGAGQQQMPAAPVQFPASQPNQAPPAQPAGWNPFVAQPAAQAQQPAPNPFG